MTRWQPLLSPLTYYLVLRKVFRQNEFLPLSLGFFIIPPIVFKIRTIRNHTIDIFLAKIGKCQKVIWSQFAGILISAALHTHLNHTDIILKPWT